MRDLKNISFKHPRDLLRTIIYFLLLTGVMGTSGCATTILFSEGKPYRSHGEFVLTDTIFALGIPDEALSRKIASDSVIFLGKKNTYVLERGGKELMYIGQELDGNKLKLNDIPHQLFLEDNNVWGRLSLSYVAWGITRKGKAEIEKLELLEFRDFGFGTYRKTINVRGVVYPPMSIDDAQLQRLKQSRELSFYRPDGPSGGLDPIRLVYLPFALAIDLATAVPQLALIGMNVLVITIKDKKDY
jgi:hypothetical protein